jgi:hypothetical protein
MGEKDSTTHQLCAFPFSGTEEMGIWGRQAGQFYNIRKKAYIQNLSKADYFENDLIVKYLSVTAGLKSQNRAGIANPGCHRSCQTLVL